MKKGKVEKEGKPIINEEPIKRLGKWYDDSLQDTENSRSTIREIQELLNVVDKESLPGRHRAVFPIWSDAKINVAHAHVQYPNEQD